VIASASERPAHHLPALDGLRGLAATAVVIAHALDAVAMPLPLRSLLVESPLALIFNGSPAVQIFFVLSGFVLAASLERGRALIDLAQFYVKRVFRIHPPYVFGVLAAWGASFLFVPFRKGVGLTDWLRQATQTHLEAGDLLASFAFPGSARGQLMVGWTLQIEMVFSLLLPLLVAGARPARGLPLLAASALLLLLPDERGGLPLGVLWYAIEFSFGVVAYRERRAIGAWLRGLPRWARVACVAAALGFLCAPFVLRWSVPIANVIAGGFYPRDIAVMSVGAFGLVAATASLPALERFFAADLCRFLGRISYSVYLLHLPVIGLLAPRMVRPGVVESWVVFVGAVLGVTIAVSMAFHRAIERPSIALGNRLCRRLARRFGARYLVSRAVEGP